MIITMFEVCGLFWSGVVAIFGPQDDIPSMHVQSICENYDIPHIEARSEPNWHRSDLSINLYPSPNQLCSVYIDLVRAWDWHSFAIIYDANDGKYLAYLNKLILIHCLSRLTGILHFKEFFDRNLNESWSIKIFQLRSDIPYRDVLWEVKRSNEKNIILDVRTDVFDRSAQSGTTGRHSD